MQPLRAQLDGSECHVDSIGESIDAEPLEVVVYGSPWAGKEGVLRLEASGVASEPPADFRRSTGSKGLRALELDIRFPEDACPKRIVEATWESSQPEAQIHLGAAAELYRIRSEKGTRLSSATLMLENVDPDQTMGFFWEW